MKNKLTAKLVIVIVVSITLLAGIMAPIYFYLQPKMYIKQEAQYVREFSEKLKSLEPFDTENISKFFEDSKVTYRVYVFDKSFTPVFSSIEMGNNKKFLHKLFGDKTDQFRETSQPQFAKLEDESAVRLYTKAEINGKTYFINIKNNLSGVEEVFNFSNRILT